MRALVGGITATELRRAQMSEAAFEALRAGLSDPNPTIRWCCVGILDHVPAPRALTAIAELLNDPVPRVRRNAAHALGCVVCKPDWCGELPVDVTAVLAQLAEADPNAKVRAEARRALTRRAR
jgi:HEAT repeat protein